MNRITPIEEKSRAILAATRSAKKGFVYLLCDGSGYWKIGWTQYECEKRIKELQCGNPKQLRLIAQIDGSLGDEARLHQRFASFWIRGEWFRANGAIADAFKV